MFQTHIHYLCHTVRPISMLQTHIHYLCHTVRPISMSQIHMHISFTKSNNFFCHRFTYNHTVKPITLTLLLHNLAQIIRHKNTHLQSSLCQTLTHLSFTQWLKYHYHTLTNKSNCFTFTEFPPSSTYLNRSTTHTHSSFSQSNIPHTHTHIYGSVTHSQEFFCHIFTHNPLSSHTR